MPFEDKDLKQLEQHEIEVAEVLQQLERYRQGFRPLNLIRPARVGDGITRLSAEARNRLVAKYEEEHQSYTVEKFVPASGAATRMFKLLFELLSSEKLDMPLAECVFETPEARQFVSGLERFAFYEEWNALGSVRKLEGRTALMNLLNVNGLGYGSKPKALLAFHREREQSTNPLFTHALESLAYSQSRLHFTISEEHRSAIESELALLSKQHDWQVDYTFSYQKPSTDTVAVDLENQLIRGADGEILFRPAGHGALIQNLNARKADFIFIKNIDNVCPLRSLEQHNYYKKVIGGLAIEITREIHRYQRLLDEELDRIDWIELTRFLKDNFGHYLPEDQPKAGSVARTLLFRPFRVCAMVPNENEPGGGPFWVELNGRESLQIIESAQIDKQNADQLAIMNQSTHFNPVDMVVSRLDYRGRPYELNDFVDRSQGFIAQKSHAGNPIKALELPGLWNGAMAHWNTLFVEVPAETFNPVKTVLDLLKSSHQA